MILSGHVIDRLQDIEPGSVQTCVTSPPYWGLRDYGTEPQQWPEVRFSPVAGLPEVVVPAQIASLGLEPDPWAFVAHMVQVFRGVRSALADDGTLWLNLGDSYAANRSYQVSPTKWPTLKQGQSSMVPPGLKPKDLCGIPWRVAFALQADGWYLRSDIIWHKPNPMPSSVRDRCTTAHEYLFMLSKNKRYYWDQEAIREADSGVASGAGFAGRQGGSRTVGVRGGAGTEDRFEPGSGRNKRDVWTITTKPFPGSHFATFPPELPRTCIKAGSRVGDLVLDPFSGAGTTGMVARQLQRSYVGIELNSEYAQMGADRIADDMPLFNRDR